MDGDAGAGLKGRLLVANPALPDVNFHRAVVLLLDHGEEGAVGVVLNRPSTTEVGDAVPQWEALAAEPPVLFVGGPVQQEAAICLAEVGGAEDGEAWRRVMGELGTLDLAAGEGDLQGHVQRIRVFAGYAGWGTGQLETELAAGAWFVADARPEDVLSEEPGLLWRRVLKRQGGLLAALANHPDDPSVN